MLFGNDTRNFISPILSIIVYTRTSCTFNYCIISSFAIKMSWKFEQGTYEYVTAFGNISKAEVKHTDSF